MKPHERRATGAYPYFKLATWDARALCWRDGKYAIETHAAAVAEAAKKPGRYRISRIEDAGRTDLEPFDVTDSPASLNQLAGERGER